MKIKNAVCYSYHLLAENPMAHLRLIGPLRNAGINIINGIDNNQINHNRVYDGDIVIIQREFPEKFESYEEIIKIAHQEGKPVVFDLDDLLFFLPESHPDRQSAVFAPPLLPMFQCLTEADLVSVSTPKLQEVLVNYNNQVVVLPNYFDDNLWHLSPPTPKKAAQEILTIGYMGGDSHKPDLEYITPVLLEILKRYPQKVRFQFWGVQPPAEILHLPEVRWIASEPRSYEEFSLYFQTQEADIFIAPLVDNLFNRCKSSIKFFEYSALGVPGIYSCLETYTDVISHGNNGLLASSLDEWMSCLIKLIEDEELRLNIAKNAQETIKSKWLLSQNAFRWDKAFEGASNQLASKRIKNNHDVSILESINPQLIEAFYKKDTDIYDLTRNVNDLTRNIIDLSDNLNEVSKKLTDKENLIQFLNSQEADKERTIQTLTTQIAEIHGSRAWRLIQASWKLRTAIVPHGSHRERWLRSVLHAGSFVKRYKKMDSQEEIPPLIDTQPSRNSVIAQEGKPCPIPSISIVIEKNSEVNLPFVNQTDVLSWVSRQTLQGVEVVVWESDTGRAVTIVEPSRMWPAHGLEELCHGLGGRYLCMASPDLLKREPVYLDTNLIALESEGLAFTVNSLGKPDWVLVSAGNGYLPGDRNMPFFRQVVRTDCVLNDFTLDIASCLVERPDNSANVGKLIVHTTAFPDAPDTFPAKTHLVGDFEISLKGNYILARNSSHISWDSLVQVIHPVSSVMPVFPERSNLPTVIIFLPFLAVGGAERLVLELIRFLKNQARFVVVTVEGMDPSLGTTADIFHQTIPFVYTAADYLLPSLNISFLSYLIERFQADTFYIANGSNIIYNALAELHQKYPNLRIVDQVYDHQIGWITRYNPTVVASINGHISANPNISHAYAERGVSSERIHFVEHAVNLEDINPADYPFERCIQIKEKLGLPEGKKLVTFCARLHPQKRPLDFIELARRFANEDFIHFLMVGDGQLSDIVDEQVLRTGLKNFTRCKFYTPISDIYAITDVMVVPSEFEAMPLVILETQAMGKPVVATDVGYIRDVLEMTHGGIVVPNIGDVAALRLGVIKALNEPVDAAAMRKVIEKRFGISYIAQQYLKVWLVEEHA